MPTSTACLALALFSADVPCSTSDCGCGSALKPSEAPLAMAQQMAGLYDLQVPFSAGVNQVLIKAHIVQYSDGSGGLPVSRLNQAMSDLSQAFASSPMQFSLIPEIDYIANDVFASIPFTSFDNPTYEQLRQVNQTANAIDIYFVPDLQLLCGISHFTFSSGTPGILMANICTGLASNPSTFPHEVGH